MMKSIILLRLLAIFALIVQNNSLTAEPDQRLCADENCEEIISLGNVIRNYIPGQEGVLPLKISSVVKIKSKSSNSDLWGVEVDGKNGYAPKLFLKEYKIYHSDASLKPGIPRIAPPKTVKKKLKGSEKQKGSKDDLTATVPLVKDMENERILSKVDGGQVSNEIPLNVTPTTTVVDGTELANGTATPLDKSGEQEVKEIFQNNGNLKPNENGDKSEVEGETDGDGDEEEDEDEDEGDDDDDENEEGDAVEEIKNKDTPSNPLVEHSTNSEETAKEDKVADNEVHKTNDVKNGEPNAGAEQENKNTVGDLFVQSSEAAKVEQIVGQEDMSSIDNRKPEDLFSMNTLPSSETTLDNNKDAEKPKVPLDAVVSNESNLQTNEPALQPIETIEKINSSNSELVATEAINKHDNLTETQKSEDEAKANPLNIEDSTNSVTAQTSPSDLIGNPQQLHVQPTMETPASDIFVAEKINSWHPTNNLYGEVPSQLYSVNPLEVQTTPNQLQNAVTDNTNSVTAQTSPSDLISNPQQLHVQPTMETPASDIFVAEKVNSLHPTNNFYGEVPSQLYSVNPLEVQTTPNQLQNAVTDASANKAFNEHVAQHEAQTFSPQFSEGMSAVYNQAAIPPMQAEHSSSQTYYQNSFQAEATTVLPDTTNVAGTQQAPDQTYAQYAHSQAQAQTYIPYNTHSGQENYANNFYAEPVAASQENVPSIAAPPVQNYQTMNGFYNQGAGSAETPASNIVSVDNRLDLPKGGPETEMPSQQSIAVQSNWQENPSQTGDISSFQNEVQQPAQEQLEVPNQRDQVALEEHHDTNTQDTHISEEVTQVENINHPSANDIVPSDVPSEIPQEAPNTEQQSSPENEIESSTTTNDPKPENEDVTTPVPTTPEIEDPVPDPIDFYVTTENPKAPNVQPPQQPQVGLFQTILGTVKGLLPAQEPVQETDFSNELDRILFPKKENPNNDVPSLPADEFCEKETNCPSSDPLRNDAPPVEEYFFKNLSQRFIELFDVLCCMLISATAALLFIFGYYCLSQCRKESQLIAKLNVVERSLLASHKEASILKHDLGETCDKLASIENNSFGSNDMVIAIKKELEVCEESKAKLEEQVLSLEKELENAAEAGLELNKIVSELLSNQTGDESIISSVEELQRQLNEQQHTILEINAVLADKSRENSELQLMLAEQNAKFVGEIASLQQDNDELEGEKNILKSKLDEMKTEFDLDITKALEGKNAEIKRLQSDIMDLRAKCDDEHRKWQTSVAKIEALENCLKNVKRDPSIKVSQLLDVADAQAEILDIKRQRNDLKEKLEIETDARKLLDVQLKSSSSEIEKLKHDYNQSEKDKLEAQTRLEVLSNYFKEKENQLQKELSLKETMWLQQQGETTSTVDRLTSMQEEIQNLRSQNDSLRAEIEAQLAAHKAQIGTLENRAHESWLSARQSERKCEEARNDATALRRKLTSLVGGNSHNLTKENNTELNLLPPDPNNAPSPILMDSPASPMLGRMPPPFLPPPPFMGPPLPDFMGMQPPFMSQGELRRLMSPPPPPGAPHLQRYSPIDDEDEDDIHGNGYGHWRDTYSPPRHSYRYSPDRYIYNPDLVSNYDTETDFSPPPSPRERTHRSGSRSGSYKAYSPPPQTTSSQSKDRPKKSSKGHMSSGSEKSYDSWKKKSKAMV